MGSLLAVCVTQLCHLRELPLITEKPHVTQVPSSTGFLIYVLPHHFPTAGGGLVTIILVSVSKGLLQADPPAAKMHTGMVNRMFLCS